MTDEAGMLAEMARGVLGDRDALDDPWGPMVDGGWIGVGVDEAKGGCGGTLMEAAALSEASGAVGSPCPVTETIAAAIVIGAAHDGAELLAELATGQRRAVLGCGLAVESSRIADDSVALRTDGWSIPYADHCTDVVVPTVTDVGDEAIVVLRTDELALEPDANAAGEPRARALSARVQARPHIITGGLAQVESMIAVLGAARLVGAMRAAQRLSVAYANDRHQFGQPIGSFQAIAHALVAQAGEVAQASAVLDAALRSPDLPVLGYAARLMAARAARPVAEIAHQTHGAIGTTHEHDLHHFTMRLLAWRLELGRPRAWGARLGDAVADRSTSWWSEIDDAATVRDHAAAR